MSLKYHYDPEILSLVLSDVESKKITESTIQFNSVYFSAVKNNALTQLIKLQV